MQRLEVGFAKWLAESEEVAVSRETFFYRITG